MEENVKEMKLRVEGIPCRGCAEDFDKVLSNTEGILDASINYEEGIFIIRYNPGIIDRKQTFITARKLVRKASIVAES
ncbi:MAG: cation transporter [Candidatus Mariimomonas ferrooxydans]